MTTLSDEQFKTLMDHLAPTPKGNNDPAALGPMRPCELGVDKMTRLQNFECWLEEAESRMKYIGTTDNHGKITLMKAWGGPDMVDFMKTNAGVKFDSDDYDEIVMKTKDEMEKLVNRSIAIHELFSTRQGSLSWMEYIRGVEKKARILDFDSKPYRHCDAVKDALIFGMKDDKLREKALADDPDLKTLIKLGQSRESGKEGAAAISINRVRDHIEDSEMEDSEIDDMIQSLTVMKLKRYGKYSQRKNNPKFQEGWKTCRNCNNKHKEGKCFAEGKTCFTCGEKNHLSNTQSCKGRNSIKKCSPTNYGASAMRTDDSETDDEWPGVQPDNEDTVRFIKTVNRIDSNRKRDKWVKVYIGGEEMQVYTDTGSTFTIIPPEKYKKGMGKLESSDTNLRAWGSKDNLKVKGMFRTTIRTRRGATTRTRVYIVKGFNPEPLLGDGDAEQLGFISFNKEGRHPTQEESTGKVRKVQVDHKGEHCIPERLRKSLNIDVQTMPKKTFTISKQEKELCMEIVNKYKGTVFNDHKIGKVLTKPIHLEFEQDFIPVQPNYRPVPIHYKTKVSKHLQFLREQDVIEDVDPSSTFDCVLNVVITEKKAGTEEIRMNIDNIPLNRGIKRTKYHIQTPQEIRHDLKEAKIFSEMDMGHGYHQLLIDEETSKKAIFQTHEGVHRMKRLYFGPTAATGIFHNEIHKALTGLKGTTNIHDNLLVWGSNEEEHRQNLENCLQRCKEKGITLKLSKSTIGMSRIEWFGRIFTPNGVSADPRKIQTIRQT